jgi:hypothetical protein
VLSHRQPFDVLGMGGHGFSQLGLGDGGNGVAVIGEVFELGTGRARVGGDGHGPEPRAGKPQDFHLRRIVEVHQHVVAGLDAAPAKAGRRAPNAVAKLPIRPGLALARKRLPNQEGVIAAGFGPEI